MQREFSLKYVFIKSVVKFQKTFLLGELINRTISLNKWKER